MNKKLQMLLKTTTAAPVLNGHCGGVLISLSLEVAGALFKSFLPCLLSRFAAVVVVVVSCACSVSLQQLLGFLLFLLLLVF